MFEMFKKTKKKITKLSKLVFTLRPVCRMCLVGHGLCFKSKSVMYEKGFIKCSAQYCKSFQALKKIHKMTFDSGHISWKGKLMDNITVFSLSTRRLAKILLYLNFPLKLVAIDMGSFHICRGCKLA